MLGNTRYFGLPDDFRNWVESGIKVMSGEDHLQDIASSGWCRPMGQWINTMLPAEITLLGWPTWSAACACGFACLSCLLLLLLHVCLLLFKVLSLGSRPGEQFVLLVFLVCLVCCCCSCLFVVVEITLFKKLQIWYCTESLIYCILFV